MGWTALDGTRSVAASVTKRRCLCAALSALMALGVAACGGSGEKTQSGTETTERTSQPATTGLAHAELVSRLNRLCDESNSKVDTLKGDFEHASATGNLTALADVIAKLVDVNRAAERELEGMTPNAQDRSAFDRYREAIRHRTGAFERMLTALRSGDRAGANSLNGVVQETNSPRINAAIDLGADRCGKP